MRLSTLFLFLIIVLQSACSGNVSALPQETNAPESQPTSTSPAVSPSEPTLEATSAPPTPSPQSVAPQPAALSQYTISARLDYDGHTATVDQEVAYVNNTGDVLQELLLIVDTNRFPSAFTLNDLAWQDGQPVEGYQLEGPTLVIPLRTSLNPQETVAFSLSYQLNIPNQNAPFGYTERQTNLGDWYPYVPPYVPGEGWLVREAAYLGEHLAYDVADFQVDIELATPASADGRPLVIAASAPAEQQGERYHYQFEAARSFAWSVSDQYQVLTTTVGAVTVSGYSFPFHAAADEPALQAAADALALYSEIFGPYPHKSLSVVEADFLNGMEYEGLFFLSHAFYDFFTGTPENNLIIIAAHETAHQWFYGWVGNDQALEPWLDEALSTYSESLFYENLYPELLDWWWQNRIYFHDPQGWVDITIYEAAGFYPYRDTVYLRGTLFMKDLEDLMGKGAFLDFLRDYLHTYRYQLATADDFFNLLQQHTFADLTTIVDTYFENR